jgi:transketolase
VTMEEHSVLGGLGGSVAEWLTDHPQPSSRLLRCGTADEFLHETANHQQAREYFGLTALNLVERIRSVLHASR